LTLLVPEQNSELDTPGGFNVLDLVESGSFRSCVRPLAAGPGFEHAGSHDCFAAALWLG
jgi:hypothetical protein